ncbi:hypothetical protein PCH_Pc21g13390 [Penicillium rubens Wisconsin 54-1255]|uniref:Uncharacterized protein n=1 Tax=Penicillium rubens (strain ATCC 28089 / DSM 1075 / NRRL 1951 / Wisconsin 54-1255) TaxID=500485 RepID=B6HMU9_PENRW|nr:hypothetical protein PCH_Pc21g13390 [Penicillium rubens Wisconsin 54-1255]
MTRTAEFPIVCDLPDLQAKHEQSKRVHLIQDTKDREGRKRDLSRAVCYCRHHCWLIRIGAHVWGSASAMQTVRDPCLFVVGIWFASSATADRVCRFPASTGIVVAVAVGIVAQGMGEEQGRSKVRASESK